MDYGDDLDNGPMRRTERRVRTPARAPPVKRRVGGHEEEPETKKLLIDGDNNGAQTHQTCQRAFSMGR